MRLLKKRPLPEINPSKLFHPDGPFPYFLTIMKNMRWNSSPRYRAGARKNRKVYYRRFYRDGNMRKRNEESGIVCGLPAGTHLYRYDTRDIYTLNIYSSEAVGCLKAVKSTDISPNTV